LKALSDLRAERLLCDFSVKKNFPDNLKALFSTAVSTAMDYQALNADFWAHITYILPYNTFTMKVRFILFTTYFTLMI
jgi:hypothetical protein